MALIERTFDATNVILPYLFSQPENHSAAVDGRLPLIFFLHGAGERGRDLDLIRHYGIPRAAQKLRDFPFLTLSPQCPPHTYWEDLDSVLFALLDEVMARYPVDPARIYLTGLSMGGHGTWILALQRPECFAALAPVCSPFPDLPEFDERLLRLKNKPIWVFHGAKDDVIPVQHSGAMVRALRQINPQVRYTIYPSAKHDAWVRAYADPALYDWFLKQSLPATAQR